MAKIPEGLLGAFIGKVVPVTAYVTNGTILYASQEQEATERLHRRAALKGRK